MYNKLWLTCMLLITVLQASAQSTLKIQAGAVIKTTGGAIITLQDMSLDNNGTINQAPGKGAFRFTGTADNTISGTSTPCFVSSRNKLKKGQLTLTIKFLQMEKSLLILNTSTGNV